MPKRKITGMIHQSGPLTFEIELTREEQKRLYERQRKRRKP